MRILIVQTSFLGDVILSTPVVAAVRELHPHSEIHLLTTPRARELVERDPLLAGALTFDKRGRERGVLGLLRAAKRLRALRFDRVYSLHRSWRTALLLALARIPLRVGFRNARLRRLYHRLESRDPAAHDVIRNLSILSSERTPDALPQELRLFPPDRASEEIEAVAARAGRFAVLVPGSAWATKRWDAAGFREVALRLEAEGVASVCIGEPSEEELCSEVARGTAAQVLCGKTTLSDAAWLIARAALVVCNDSMALHMASALKTPAVAIFCATSPSFGFGPWRNRAAVVEREDLACKPCSRHGGAVCPTGTWSCIRELPAERVVAAARLLLEHPPITVP